MIHERADRSAQRDAGDVVEKAVNGDGPHRLRAQVHQEERDCELPRAPAPSSLRGNNECRCEPCHCNARQPTATPQELEVLDTAVSKPRELGFDQERQRSQWACAAQGSVLSTSSRAKWTAEPCVAASGHSVTEQFYSGMMVQRSTGRHTKMVVDAIINIHCAREIPAFATSRASELPTQVSAKLWRELRSQAAAHRMKAVSWLEPYCSNRSNRLPAF